MAEALRFLIAEGNPSDRNAALMASGGRPGSRCLAEVLTTLVPACQVDVVHPADGDVNFPTGVELSHYHGVLISGSALNIPGGDDDPRVQRQVDLAKAVFEAKVPLWGSCWGLQVAVAASGGLVQASPSGGEMALARKIAINEDGRGHLLHLGREGVFDAPAIHLDEVTHVSSGSVVLSSNNRCAIQSVSITHNGGTCWAVQYHPEFDLADMAILVERYGARLISQGFFSDEAAVSRHAERLNLLHQHPENMDVAWLLGMDGDVLDAAARWREVENWITHLVRPSAAR